MKDLHEVEWQWYWRSEDGEANCGVFCEPTKGHAYSICRAPRYEIKETWEKHAKLIAAAPKMLAMLRRYASECAECDGTGQVRSFNPARQGHQHHAEDCVSCADIRALISKATSEDIPTTERA